MVNNYIQSSMIGPPVEDVFMMKALSFHVEKQNSQFDPERDIDEYGDPHPLDFQIKRIDVIYNPEYEKLF